MDRMIKFLNICERRETALVRLKDQEKKKEQDVEMVPHQKDNRCYILLY